MTDGQMALGQVTIYDEAAHWDEADIQVLTRNDVRPHAYIGGLTSENPAHTIRIGRNWDGSTGAQGAWEEPNGYRTLIHEFGHYALFLADSYFLYTFDGNGDAIGQKAAACTGLNLVDTVNASVMDRQYGASELAAFGTPGLWDPVNCAQTAQWQLNQESDWQTVVRRYRDPEEPARWRFNTPLDSFRVMVGPAELPPALLPFPHVSAGDAGQTAPPWTVTILTTPGGPPYAQSALVALQHRRNGRLVTLDQGSTGPAGQIEVLGAGLGDEVRVLASDGSRSVRQLIGAGAQYTISLGAATVQAQDSSVNPYARTPAQRRLSHADAGGEWGWCSSGVGRELFAAGRLPGSEHQPRLCVGQWGLRGCLRGRHAGPGQRSRARGRGRPGVGHFGQRPPGVPRSTRPGAGLLCPGGRGLGASQCGQPRCRGCVLHDHAGRRRAATPAGRHDSRRFAYSLHASGALLTLDRPGVLRLFCDPSLLPAGVRVQDLMIARWDGAAWQMLADSAPDPDHQAITVGRDHLGTYMLSGPAHPYSRRFTCR